MARMAARIVRYRGDARLLLRVAHIVDERPGAVQRGGPEIVRIPCDDIAARVAHAAADAFDAGIGGLARGRSRIDARGRLGARALAREITFRVAPFVEET